MSHLVGFIVNTQGEVTPLEVSDAMYEAYDMLEADNCDMDRVTSLLEVAERDGQDPVTFAAHFIELRHAIGRGVMPNRPTDRRPSS